MYVNGKRERKENRGKEERREKQIKTTRSRNKETE
jgi:hypothetical protein